MDSNEQGREACKMKKAILPTATCIYQKKKEKRKFKFKLYEGIYLC